MAGGSSASERDSSAEQDGLNGHSAAILILFVIASIVVIWPVRIALPLFLRRPIFGLLRLLRIIGRRRYDAIIRDGWKLPISLETAPFIAVLILLASTTIHGSTIKLGIKGDENIKPYDVLVLFIALAYISIALDGTGGIEAIAFWVSKRAGTSGRRLFTVLYVFFLGAGLIIGNDPLILSGTPFLAYLTHHTGMEPTAWVFSEFMAANTASAVLVSSNPTNILIASSFKLNFITDFTKWTILPSIVPGVITYGILYFMFRHKIPKVLTPLTHDPWSKVRDRFGAYFFSILMLVTIAVLVGTSFAPNEVVQVWMVTAPAGILAFLYDVCNDFFFTHRRKKAEQRAEGDAAADGGTKQFVSSSASLGTNLESDGEKRHDQTPKPRTGQLSSDALETNQKVETEQPSTVSQSGPSDTNSPATKEKEDLHSPAKQDVTNNDAWNLYDAIIILSKRFPGTTETVRRLPLPLLPFAMCEFILVRGLAQRGWIHVFAEGFINACRSPAATVFFMGFVCAAFLCPLAGTNIGATIILVEIIRDPAFANSATVKADPRILAAAIYSVALGSNIGAFSYTFAGSLAGLLWRALLLDKGISISQLKFAIVNFAPLLMQITVACAIIYGQLYWFPVPAMTHA